MKGKPIFYLNGNERNFRDHYTISLMTGEPMPKKWQRYIELTTEEKARWDADLKLDEEYRIAEAQGFPNGIPGGKMRGNILYTITQRDDREKRKLQEENQQGGYFSSQKTVIHNGNNVAQSYTPVSRQGSFMQPDTGIKKEPAFNVEKAVHEVASRFRALCEANDAQAKMNMQKEQEDILMNGTMIADTSDSMVQTFGQIHDNQDNRASAEDPLEQWVKNLEKGDYVILGDENEDGLVMPRKEFLARYGKGQSELHNPVWDSDYGRSSVDTMPNSMSEKEYIYPIQRPCADMKKAPYVNVQKMLYVNKENERYNTNTFRKDGIDGAVYNWDYGGARDHDEMHYQQYNDGSFVRGWPSDKQNFNNGYPEDSDSRYMFTTVGTDGDALINGPAFVEDISAIMKEWGSAYNDWVAGLKQEDKAALGLLSGIVLDVAEIFVARIPFFPLRIAGIAVLMSITIYRAAKEVEADWKRKVEETMRKENCSEKEAEKMLKPVLIGLVANKIMEKVREEWVKKYLDDDGMPELARVVITQDWTDALEAIAGDDSEKPTYDFQYTFGASPRSM